MRRRLRRGVVCALVLAGPVARAQEAPPPAPPVAMPWQYGAFVDLGALLDSNSPGNHLFRNRGTTPRVDELDLNMTAVYVRKTPTESSRAGLELTIQAGRDSEAFGFSATAPNLRGSDVLRHLGPTDVSYIVPIGDGVTIQGGIFNSVIGYDSLYAKDNFSYTRPWGADYTPYLMMGVNASYPVTPRLTATALVVNGYWHLAHANDMPSAGGQLAYKASEAVTVKEAALYGPHQTDTSISHWRVLSDTIVEHRADRITAAFEYQVGAERVATAADAGALWMSAQVPVHWSPGGRWSMTMRPEFCWDRDGRWTGFEQSVTALTATVEYRRAFRGVQAIVRAEYRLDDSRGGSGGFFVDGAEPAPPGLTPTQQLGVVGFILTFDRHFAR